MVSLSVSCRAIDVCLPFEKKLVVGAIFGVACRVAGVVEASWEAVFLGVEAMLRVRVELEGSLAHSARQSHESSWKVR